MAQWNSQQFHLRAAWKYERDRIRPAAKYEPAFTYTITILTFFWICQVRCWRKKLINLKTNFPGEVQQIIILDKKFLPKYVRINGTWNYCCNIRTNSCYLARLIVSFCYPQFLKIIFQHFGYFLCIDNINE